MTMISIFLYHSFYTSSFKLFLNIQKIASLGFVFKDLQIQYIFRINIENIDYQAKLIAYYGLALL